MFGWSKTERDREDQKIPEPEKQNYEIPTVKFDPTKVTEAIKIDLRQNIKSLIEVASDNFDMIYDATLRSISAGRALDIVYQALMTIDGISKRRAADISLSLNNKATVLIEIEEQKRIGIKYAIWRYSGAPCGSVEQDDIHKAANGKPYSITKGMLLNGQWTWPGREDRCRCVSKSMIVGFDGYMGGKPEGYLE